MSEYQHYINFVKDTDKMIDSCFIWSAFSDALPNIRSSYIQNLSLFGKTGLSPHFFGEGNKFYNLEVVSRDCVSSYRYLTVVKKITLFKVVTCSIEVSSELLSIGVPLPICCFTNGFRDKSLYPFYCVRSYVLYAKELRENFPNAQHYIGRDFYVY